MKLPSLDKNIKNGNSLISGTDEELKRYFGKNFRDKKPFNWQEEFPEVFKQGGFDVIMGNPPWVFTRGENFTDDEKSYFNNFLISASMKSLGKGKDIQSGKLNLYSLFIVRGIELVKNNGKVSFIIPNNILRTTTFDVVRKFILDSTKINEIVDLGDKVFHGVTASSVILEISKVPNQTDRINNKVNVYSDLIELQIDKTKVHTISQESFYKNPSLTFNILSNDTSTVLSQKIENKSEKMGLYTEYIIEGIVGSLDRDVTNEKINDMYKPFLLGKDIEKYRIKYKNRWICYDRQKLHRARPEEVFKSEKILVQRISGGNNPLIATLDKHQYYTFASLNNIVLKKDTGLNMNFLLGLLNSKLINWYYSTNFSNRSKLTVNVSKTFLSQIPIKIVKRPEQETLINLVKSILELNNKKNLIKENSEKWLSIRSEIEKIDKMIDQEVYKLYGLTHEEIDIVEKQ